MITVTCEYCGKKMTHYNEKAWLKIDEHNADYFWQTGDPLHRCHYCPDCKGYYTIAVSYGKKMAEKYGPNNENDKKCQEEFEELMKI